MAKNRENSLIFILNEKFVCGGDAKLCHVHSGTSTYPTNDKADYYSFVIIVIIVIIDRMSKHVSALTHRRMWILQTAVHSLEIFN